MSCREKPATPEERKQCEERLNELGSTELTNLRFFAERRLLRMGAGADLAEDMVQEAVLSVLQGLSTETVGRCPRTEDLATKDAFENYMRGIISSKIEAYTRRRCFKAVHQQAAEGTNEPGLGVEFSGVVLIAPERSAGEQVAESDFREQFFATLRLRAPGRLQHEIDLWELSDDGQSIPARGRNYMDLKRLAKEVLAELTA